MDYPIKQFESQKELEKWVETNSDSDGVWLKFAKKGSGETTVNYAEAIESALCYGWIDSQVKTFDKKFYLQKFTPRRAKSVWSKINVERVEALIKEGRMKPAGLAQVQAAKADGRWDNAYSGQATAEMPQDFKSALAKNPKAASFYENLSNANKYAFTWRLQNVKRPETRAANIEKYVKMLAAGKSLH